MRCFIDENELLVSLPLAFLVALVLALCTYPTLLRVYSLLVGGVLCAGLEQLSRMYIRSKWMVGAGIFSFSNDVHPDWTALLPLPQPIVFIGVLGLVLAVAIFIRCMQNHVEKYMHRMDRGEGGHIPPLPGHNAPQPAQPDPIGNPHNQHHPEPIGDPAQQEVIGNPAQREQIPRQQNPPDVPADPNAPNDGQPNVQSNGGHRENESENENGMCIERRHQLGTLFALLAPLSYCAPIILKTLLPVDDSALQLAHFTCTFLVCMHFLLDAVGILFH